MALSETALTGVLPPLATPFDGRGDLDVAALVHNVRRYEKTGLAGYVCFGSNGEAVHLTPAERRRVLEAVRETVGERRFVVAGVNEQSTRAAVAACREAAEAGADAVLVITPFFYKAAMTQEALRRFYLDVADSSPLPVALYTFPQATGVTLEPATIAALAAHERVVGVKDSSGDLRAVGETLRLVPEGFRVLVGNAGIFLDALVMGAAGGILAVADVAPETCVGIWRAHQAGDAERARDLQRRLAPVAAAVTTEAGIPGLKAAMDLLGYRGGTVRRPLPDLGDPQRRRLRAVLAASGLPELRVEGAERVATPA